jgi:hypothetical protein
MSAFSAAKGAAMSNRIGVAFVMFAAMAAAVCSSPTQPTQSRGLAQVGLTSISGTVFVHAAGGVVPAASAWEWGWQEESESGSGRAQNAILTSGDGHYAMYVASNVLRVRVTAASQTATSYQPCAITVTPAPGLKQDVHIITDTTLLGAHLPAALQADTPLQTGQVFETTGNGRRPLANVSLSLNGLYGDDLIFATTLTDSDGRFMFCGVPFAPSLFLWASKAGYDDFSRGNLDGSPIEIELRPNSPITQSQ